MKQIIALSFLLPQIIFSQNDDTLSVEFLPTDQKLWHMPGASFGMEFYRDKNFQHYFGDSLNSNFGQISQFVNLDYFVSVDFASDVHISVSYVLPYSLNISDSLNYSLGGYGIGIATAFKLTENKNFQMPVHGGYKFGHIYLHENDVKMKNFYFDIFAEINPRLVLFNRLVLFGVGTLNWDITKQHWKSKSVTPGSHLNFKHTSGSFQVGLGWKFETVSQVEPDEDY